MTDFPKSRGYYGSHYDRCVERSDSSFVRMQQHYWATKQAVYKKLGKKEDDCIVASDSELDSRLEMFRAIEESCFELMRVLENYQDKICALSQEENAIGRFLKECGKHDKTRAGKMMTATGKTLSYTAQQRLSLRIPLVRLYQEVETFQYRAIVDTFQTIEKMEKSRTTYRGALLWMKDVSQQLDPDMYKQLEKFRKVQGHVRRTKSKFDKFKIDTLQKIDLLAASRCNMFSHVLAAYQNTLLQFWEKTSHTMGSVAESFRGYQHYEFAMLKELTEPSKLLAEKTSSKEKPVIGEDSDKDTMLFFVSEYHDEEEDEKDGVSGDKKESKSKKSGSLQNLFDSSTWKTISSSQKEDKNVNKKSMAKTKSKNDVPLLFLDDDISNEEDDSLKSLRESAPPSEANAKNEKKIWTKDLLTNNPEIDDYEKDDLTLLSEILNAPPGNIPTIPVCGADDSFSHQWQATFGSQPHTPEKYIRNGSCTDTSKDQISPPDVPSFLPSQLLEMNSNFAQLDLSSQGGNTSTATDLSGPSSVNHPSQPTSVASKSASGITRHKKEVKDMSSWFNLFADLDPLANPDAIGKNRSGDDDDRNC